MPSSGAGGPCCHCGVRHSCCWRRGPASKPVLCNACGSRYLVKRSLDGYQPLQTRREQSAAREAAAAVAAGAAPAKEPARRAAAPAAPAARSSKPKRAAQKRAAASDDWSTDCEEEGSQASASLEGDSDSGGSTRAGRAAGRRQRSASPTKAAKLSTSYITSQAQLKEIQAADISAIASAFLASSLRHKPRKPLVVTVSAVW